MKMYEINQKSWKFNGPYKKNGKSPKSMKILMKLLEIHRKYMKTNQNL
jgi:hypothetical protein